MTDGRAPLADPLAADLSPQGLTQNLQATPIPYTVPVAHVRLAPHVKDRKVTLVPTTQPMGGPTAEGFGGAVDLTGEVVFDDQLPSTLDLAVKNLKLQQIPPAIHPPDPTMKDLTGMLNVNVH